nr:hypothetical protein [Propionicimonas sp.]
MESQLGHDSLVEIVMDTGLNWRLTLFLVLPVYLIWVLRDAHRLVDPLVVTRAGDYRNWLRAAVRECVGKSVPLIACLVAPAVASAVGAMPRSAWDQGISLVSGTWTQQLLVLATVCSVATNLSLLGVLVLVGTLGFGRIGGGAVSALIFAGAVVGSGSPAPFAPLNIGYGIQPQAAAEHYGSSLWALVVPTLVSLGLALAAVFFLDSRVRGRSPTTAAWASPLAVAALLALRLSVNDWADPTEVLVGAFYGSGGSLPDYLFVAIVALAPVWLATVRAEARYERLPAELIRSGTTVRWFVRSAAPSMLWYPLYQSAVLAGSLALLWLRFRAFPSPDPQFPVSPPELYYHFLVNGTLQGWCFLVVVHASRWVAAAPWGSLTALATLVAAGAVAPRQPWLPIADLGFGQLLDGRAAAHLTAASTCWLVVLLVAAVALFSRLSVPLLERNLSSWLQ